MFFAEFARLPTFSPASVDELLQTSKCLLFGQKIKKADRKIAPEYLVDAELKAPDPRLY